MVLIPIILLKVLTLIHLRIILGERQQITKIQQITQKTQKAQMRGKHI